MPMPPECGRQAKTVLCVDDHRETLVIRRMLLEVAGYAVMTASSGAEALQLMEQAAVDAVVLDYRMPGMDGGELAARLRQMRPGLPLIMLSGYAAEIPAEVLKLVDAFVIKGQSPSVLLDELAFCLGEKPCRKPSALADSEDILSTSRSLLAESKNQAHAASEVSDRNRELLSRRRRRSQ